MAHRDAVVDRDRVELLGDAAGRLDLARDQLAEILQMDVSWHELGEGIGDGDDRLAEIAVFYAGGAPQAARAGHVAAVGGGAGAIGGHGKGLKKNARGFMRKSGRRKQAARRSAKPRRAASTARRARASIGRSVRAMRQSDPRRVGWPSF